VAIQFNEQDDFDHFKTSGCIVDGLSLDNMSVRDALKRMMNLMLIKRTCFVGELSLISLLSIEKTEVLIKHLIIQGLIEYTDNPDSEIVKLK